MKPSSELIRTEPAQAIRPGRDWDGPRIWPDREALPCLPIGRATSRMWPCGSARWSAPHSISDLREQGADRLGSSEPAVHAPVGPCPTLVRNLVRCDDSEMTAVTTPSHATSSHTRTPTHYGAGAGGRGTTVADTLARGPRVDRRRADGSAP